MASSLPVSCFAVPKGFHLVRNTPCSCKKTRCLKKYCECLRRGSACGPECTCRDCENTQGAGDAQLPQTPSNVHSTPPRPSMSPLVRSKRKKEETVKEKPNKKQKGTGGNLQKTITDSSSSSSLLSDEVAGLFRTMETSSTEEEEEGGYNHYLSLRSIASPLYLTDDLL